MRHLSNSLGIIFLILICLVLYPTAYAQVTCGSTCQTAAQVAQETINYQNKVAASKCLFSYNNQIYQPPSGTISNGKHKNLHNCGQDVTGIMEPSHLQNPSHFLIPYVCAPLCSGGGGGCQDADGDSYQSSSCGGNDCNDNNAQVHPGASETCNNIDDNCNSQIDEGLQQTSSCGKSPCVVQVTQTCINGNYSPACVPLLPGVEACDNIDNDCDGYIDEQLTQPCGSDSGECTLGVSTCSAGIFGQCIGEVLPKAEICDLLDNNCNGEVDEGDVCLSNISKLCEEEWMCNSWSDCVKSEKSTRICTDSSNCSTIKSKPATERDCYGSNETIDFQNLPQETNDSKIFIVSLVVSLIVLLAVGWMFSVNKNSRLPP